jgi:hypothetical protein
MIRAKTKCWRSIQACIGAMFHVNDVVLDSNRRRTAAVNCTQGRSACLVNGVPPFPCARLESGGCARRILVRREIGLGSRGDGWNCFFSAQETTRGGGKLSADGTAMDRDCVKPPFIRCEVASATLNERNQRIRHFERRNLLRARTA